MVIPEAFAGTWSGHIVPTPAGITSEYDVRLELPAGKPGGKWFELGDSCQGKLTLTSATASVLTFELTDVGACVPGQVTLTRKGDALIYKWEAPLLTYDGTLRKS